MSYLPEIPALSVFIIATMLFMPIPGPAVFFIVARSLGQGRSAGIASVMGVSLGAVVHVIAAAIGLSALLMSSALAFAILKYAGAAYLIWLGVKKLMSKAPLIPDMKPEPKELRRLFWDGAIVNTLNPKTALFFLAFLPQFVSPETGSITAQILFLGAIFIAIQIFFDSLWALLAGSAGEWLMRNRHMLSFERYISGTIFVGLGLVAAFSGEKK